MNNKKTWGQKFELNYERTEEKILSKRVDTINSWSYSQCNVISFDFISHTRLNRRFIFINHVWYQELWGFFVVEITRETKPKNYDQKRRIYFSVDSMVEMGNRRIYLYWNGERVVVAVIFIVAVTWLVAILRRYMGFFWKCSPILCLFQTLSTSNAIANYLLFLKSKDSMHTRYFIQFTFQ